jgi:hypothetical protein
MSGKAGALSEKPTALPARYRPRFAWKLDRRCVAVREVASDLVELWQDLGGVESLSVMQLALCERVVFIRRRVLEFESAVMSGKAPPFEAGTYSNLANVLMGYLRTLGLTRRARDLPRLHAYMNRPTPVNP